MHPNATLLETNLWSVYRDGGSMNASLGEQVNRAVLLPKAMNAFPDTSKQIRHHWFLSRAPKKFFEKGIDKSKIMVYNEYIKWREWIQWTPPNFL